MGSTTYGTMNDTKGGVAKVTCRTFEAMGQIPMFHRTYFLFSRKLVDIICLSSLIATPCGAPHTLSFTDRCNNSQLLAYTCLAAVNTIEMNAVRKVRVHIVASVFCIVYPIMFCLQQPVQ